MARLLVPAVTAVLIVAVIYLYMKLTCIEAEVKSIRNRAPPMELAQAVWQMASRQEDEDVDEAHAMVGIGGGGIGGAASDMDIGGEFLNVDDGQPMDDQSESERFVEDDVRGIEDDNASDSNASESLATESLATTEAVAQEVPTGVVAEEGTREAAQAMRSELSDDEDVPRGDPVVPPKGAPEAARRVRKSAKTVRRGA